MNYQISIYLHIYSDLVMRIQSTKFELVWFSEDCFLACRTIKHINVYLQTRVFSTFKLISIFLGTFDAGEMWVWCRAAGCSGPHPSTAWWRRRRGAATNLRWGHCHRRRHRAAATAAPPPPGSECRRLSWWWHRRASYSFRHLSDGEPSSTASVPQVSPLFSLWCSKCIERLKWHIAIFTRCTHPLWYERDKKLHVHWWDFLNFLRGQI